MPPTLPPQLVMPDQDRVVTVRENARFQVGRPGRGGGGKGARVEGGGCLCVCVGGGVRGEGGRALRGGAPRRGGWGARVRAWVQLRQPVPCRGRKSPPPRSGFPRLPCVPPTPGLPNTQNNPRNPPQPPSPPRQGFLDVYAPAPPPRTLLAPPRPPPPRARAHTHKHTTHHHQTPPRQGFPDFYVLAGHGENPHQKAVQNGCVSTRYKQIGNAVAPPVAAALGRCLLLAAAGPGLAPPMDVPVVPVPDPDMVWVSDHHSSSSNCDVIIVIIISMGSKLQGHSTAQNHGMRISPPPRPALTPTWPE